MPALRVGLLGLGTVGTGVIKLLSANRGMIELKIGAQIEVVRALVRQPDRGRDADLPALALTTDPAAIIGAPDIDLVVEVMGGISPARDYMVQALRAGQWVITANKDVVAEYGDDLYAAAEAGQSAFFFEAAVGGGIPIIRALKESLAANQIQSVMGIVNGTTNYILTKMSQEGQDFDEALATAQRLGYAEADPTADVDGHDAARKLAILCDLAFLTRIKPAQVYTEGIRGVSARDIQMGQRFGWVVKLLAIGKAVNGEIEARVHPTFIPKDHPLASVNDVLNGIFVTGDAVGETMFYGRGAGAMPTASSVVGDLINAALARRSGGATLGCTCREHRPLRSTAAIISRYYLRLTVADQPGVLARVARAFGDAGVSIESVVQAPRTAQDAEVVFVTHSVREGQLQNAVAALRAQTDVVHRIDSVIRVEA